MTKPRGSLLDEHPQTAVVGNVDAQVVRPQPIQRRALARILVDEHDFELRRAFYLTCSIVMTIGKWSDAIGSSATYTRPTCQPRFGFTST